MKIIRKSITYILMIFSFFFISSCSLLSSLFHECEFVEKIIEPTCEEQGYTQYECSCGEQYRDTYTTALGHDYVWEIVNDPTLTTTGLAIAICNNDNLHKKEEILANLSNTSTWSIKDHLDAGCEEQGYTLYTSSYGDVLVEIAATGHNYKDYICENCDGYYSSEGLEFTLLSDNTYSVNVGSSTNSTIVIPAYYNGYPVTKLDNYAFSGCARLKKVIIPNTVTEIGEFAFLNCNSLESITIPFVGSNANGSGATNFGYLFGVNTYDSQSLIVPKSLKEVKITSEVSIYSNAFRNCNNVQTITINEGVTTIGDNAFYDCSSLTNIVIPNSLTKTGIDSFKNCNSLTYKQYNTGMYLGNNDNPYVIFMKLVNNNTTSCAISSNTNCVYYGALKGFTNLKNITLPFVGQSKFGNGETHFGYLYGASNSDVQKSYIEKSLKEVIVNDCGSINFAAFKGAELEKITLPFIGANKNYETNHHLGYIFGANSSENNASYVPSSLKEVKITNETIVVDYAFNNCSSIEKVTLNEGIKYIGYSAFVGCSLLKNISLPDSLETICSYAFYECSNLTSINIPKNVAKIENGAFTSCYNLQNIVVDSENTIYDSRNNSNAIIETSTNKLMFGCKNTIIPNSIEIIGSSVFAYIENLESIVIPNSVTKIESSAFINCSGLKEIIIPNSVKEIGPYAFSQCYNLSNVTLPDNLSSIREYAFAYCNSLKNLEIPNSVDYIASYAFYNSNIESLSLPFVGEYKDGSGKTFFGHVFGASSYDSQSSYIPSSLTKVTILDGNSISYYAFAYCSNIETIIIESGLTELTYGLFYECNNLVELVIPETVMN